ncbi:uncharacterized protein [Antedon mediterranea]|uniref:uncharacterized protein n=1 Tax=Antedon mediterranea TaxID=105859 RepID=UPI003AF67521
MERPPINLERLPNFLPANAPPKMEVLEMYNNLKKLKRQISLTSSLAKVQTIKGKNVGTLVVTDFSKVFDCIDHTLAIQRLFELGVRSELLPWITNFLTSRRQRVQYHSALSRWETLSCGVPQGTKLDPIMFMVVINTASEESLAKSFMYVDDLSLVEVRPANQPSQIGLDFQDMDAWATDNRLWLNHSKCKVMQVWFMKEPHNPPQPQIAGCKLVCLFF